MNKAIIGLILFSICFFSACSKTEEKAMVFNKEEKAMEFKPTKQISAQEQRMELTQRMFDIDKLWRKLKAKRNEINTSISAFEKEVIDLKLEIKSQGNDNLNSALQNPRIKYNLALIQQKNAYIKKLVEIAHIMMHGDEELVFLHRKTEGDLRMVNTFNQEEMGQLLKEIDLIISKYLPYADKLVINTANLKIESYGEIWTDLGNFDAEGVRRQLAEEVRQQQQKEAEEARKQQQQKEEEARKQSQRRLQEIRSGTFKW